MMIEYIVVEIVCNTWLEHKDQEDHEVFMHT